MVFYKAKKDIASERRKNFPTLQKIGMWYVQKMYFLASFYFIEQGRQRVKKSGYGDNGAGCLRKHGQKRRGKVSKYYVDIHARGKERGNYVV